MYGGAAGGGKSYALLADAVRYAIYPDYVGLILRRTNDELRELIQNSLQLYPQAFPGAKFRRRDSEWQFPSGARLWLAFLDNDDDVMRYQGQAFSYIGFDELTQYPTPHAWDYLRSRLRNKNPNIPLQQRGCVDYGDVLTESGWIDIKDVKVGENVYSLTPQGTLILRKVHLVHKSWCDDPLIRVNKKNLHMSMTQDHRVVYQKLSGKTGFCIDRWNEIKSKSVSVARTSLDYVPEKTINYTHIDWSPEEYAEFLGWYVAEGSYYRGKGGNYKVIITQLKSENHAWIRRVLDASGLNYCYSKNGDFQLTNKALLEHVEPLGKAATKKFPEEFVKYASKELLELAFRAYAAGDGSWQSQNSCQLFTSSVTLVDQLCEIGIKLGYKVQYKERNVEYNPKHNTQYIVYFSKSITPTTLVDKGNKRTDETLHNHSGYVYCLGVEDTENFILRQSGYVWVSGNTTNPGGPGHSWVKKMFIDPAPPNKTFWARNIETGEVLRFPPFQRDGVTPHQHAGKPLFQRKFIPALLQDNPYLTADPNYEANLLSLPEVERKRLLDGNWDVVSGAAFPEFNRQIHAVSPYEIPNGWTRFRSCDYGYGSHTSVLWFAVHPSGQLIVYRELYVTRVHAEDLADMIMDIEVNDRVSYGVLDSSMWHKRGDPGPSMAEKMIRRGCKWRPSDRSKGSRVSGKNELHRLLQFDEFLGQPRIVFFDTCTEVLSHLPMIPLDKKNPEDVDTHFVHDHDYDALRYGIMSRPRGANTFSFGDDLIREVRQRPVDPIFGA